MDEQAKRVLARFHQRTAGDFPFQQPKGMEPPSAQKREIPKDFPYDPKALKPLSKALFAASVALGHTLAAHKHFSQVKSPSVSPDGRIGGRGYIMGMNDIRRKLWEASEALSAVSDAIHDEINAPHWKPKLAQLDENDREDVSRFVEEAQDVRDNPGEEAEEEIEAIDKENDDKSEGDDEETGSELPSGGGAPEQASQVNDQPGQVKEASSKTGRITLRQQLVDAARDADPKMLAEIYERSYKAPHWAGVDSQTGGPRVDTREPEGGEGPFGSFNLPDEATDDDWGLSGGVSDNHQAAKEWAMSVLPDDAGTPTEGNDFGLGYGAKGQAEEHLGDWGPHAGLPGSPWQATGDTTPAIDVNVNERHSLNSLLPNDDADPVARADYYPGEKGNLVRGDEDAPAEEDLSLMDAGYVTEDLDTSWLPLGQPGLDER